MTMKMLTKLTKQSALPNVPDGIEQHPVWVKHQQRVGEIRLAVKKLQSDAAALEGEQAQIAARLGEDRVLAALGEDPGADERVAAAKARLAAVEQQLAETRDQLAIQEEVEKRLVAREQPIRQELTIEIRERVERAYVELLGHLAPALAAILPINDRLLKLRSRYLGSIGGTLQEGVWFDELRRDSPAALPTKLECWVRHARQLGVDVGDL